MMINQLSTSWLFLGSWFTRLASQLQILVVLAACRETQVLGCLLTLLTRKLYPFQNLFKLCLNFPHAFVLNRCALQNSSNFICQSCEEVLLGRKASF